LIAARDPGQGPGNQQGSAPRSFIMINHSLFFGWNKVIPGKEKIAAELHGNMIQFWMEQKEQGNVEDFIPVQLTAHDGDLNGFFLITGQRDKLLDLRWNNEVVTAMHVKASMILENYACVDGYVGESLQQVMGMWMQNLD
jgi:hypothetical protein